jgi:ATP-dependent Lhr-like helicase
VRTAWAYRDLTAAEWDWTLDFVTRGGPALAAYPEYRRVVERDGLYTMPDRAIARRHRMSIGTITSDAALTVQYVNGGRLGTVEESFLSRLRPGERFIFAGRTLELAEVRDMTAWVRRAKGKSSAVPRWMGGRMPLSTELAAAVRRLLENARDGVFASPEMAAMRPILELQARWSAIPAADELLIERLKSREGHHLFLYPFEGRLVHEGLAALLALRFTRLRKATFSLSVNDYGIEFLTPDAFPFEEALRPALFTRERLVEDILESVNLSELARRQFRDIARVAGLVLPSLPGARKSTRQVQASSSLLYDVFLKYDPDNLLLVQARREVLEQHFEQNRLAGTLERLEHSPLELVPVRRPTPLAFPLVVERISASLSNESLLERVERLKERWQREDARSA